MWHTGPRLASVLIQHVRCFLASCASISDISKESRVRNLRLSYSYARHWREYSHFQRGERRSAEPASVSEVREARGSVPRSAADSVPRHEDLLCFHCQLPGLA